MSKDIIYRQDAIDALDVLCQEHRYKIPGKGETYSQYNEAWQDALDRAEGAIGNLPSAQSEPKWILVSERLPEKDGDYLLFGKVVEDDTDDYTFIGAYDACAEKFGYWEDYYDKNTLGFLDSELIEYNKVIAWMPLPEYDRGEQDE